MSLADLIISAVVLSGATYLLYRSAWKKGQGSCHGCTSGGCRSRPRDHAELVRLGQPGAGGGSTSSRADG